MPVQATMRPRTLEELGIERKPFYTIAEVAEILGISDQSVLDRIHAPLDDRRHLYAVALGPRTYRIPVGALAQLVGIPTVIKVTKHPRRIDDALRDELASARAAAPGRKRRSG